MFGKFASIKQLLCQTGFPPIGIGWRDIIVTDNLFKFNVLEDYQLSRSFSSTIILFELFYSTNLYPTPHTVTILSFPRRPNTHLFPVLRHCSSCHRVTLGLHQFCQFVVAEAVFGVFGLDEFV